MTIVKQQGALLAKGRLLGIQFDTLFTDRLYWRIGEQGIEMARKGKGAGGYGLPILSQIADQPAVL